MIVINQRRQQPSKECALLMGELLRPGDTSKRLLKSWHRRLLNLPTSSYSQRAPSAFDAVMFTDPLPLKYGTGLSKAAGYYHFIPSHAFWTFLWQFLNPSWTVEQFADLASFPRWMQVLLLPLARGNKYTVKKEGFCCFEDDLRYNSGDRTCVHHLISRDPFVPGLVHPMSSDLLGKPLQDLHSEWDDKSSSTRFSCIAVFLWCTILYITWATPVICVPIKT